MAPGWNAAALHPGAIAPPVAARSCDPRGGAGCVVHGPAERIGLQAPAAVGAQDGELVSRTGLEARHEALPHPRACEAPHRPAAGVPGAEVAHDAHPSRAGGPEREEDARLAGRLPGTGAQHLPGPRMSHLIQQQEVGFADKAGRCGHRANHTDPRFDDQRCPRLPDPSDSTPRPASGGRPRFAAPARLARRHLGHLRRPPRSPLA